MINVRLRLEQSGETIKDTALVAPVNNFLHSLFNQVDVFFNQKAVSPPSNAYAYRAYIETLLNYSNEAKKSHLTSSLWYEDTPGEMNAPLTAVTQISPKLSTNTRVNKRNSFIKGGKTLDLLGHLHCDVFNQEKFLLNGVEMRVRLIRSKDVFCLIDYENDNVKVHLLEASLRVAHSKALTHGIVKYPLTRVEVK